MRAQRTKPRELRSASTSVQLRPDGSLTLAIVADTHSNPHPKAAQWITRLAPDAILHAGDIGDLGVLEQLGELGRVVAVRGNIDERAHDVPDAVSIELRQGESSALTLLLMHIAVAGPRIRADAAELARTAGAKLIVCGHSHVPFIGRDRGLIVFNPGSIGPRRMHLPIVFGVIEIKAGKLSMRHVDCETGAAWVPGAGATSGEVVG